VGLGDHEWRDHPEQVAKLIHGQYTTVMHRPLVTLAERLGEVLPDTLDTVFFGNSGSEAVETALRLARHANARPNIVVFHGSFHGRTIGAASMTTSGTRFRAGEGGRLGIEEFLETKYVALAATA
jgi:4-aminobutyrate aminotransferase